MVARLVLVTGSVKDEYANSTLNVGAENGEIVGLQDRGYCALCPCIFKQCVRRRRDVLHRRIKAENEKSLSVDRQRDLVCRYERRPGELRQGL